MPCLITGRYVTYIRDKRRLGISKTSIGSCTMVQLVHIPYGPLWWFNIAMDNCKLIDDFSVETSMKKGHTIAMLNNQMVGRLAARTTRARGPSGYILHGWTSTSMWPHSILQHIIPHYIIRHFPCLNHCLVSGGAILYWRSAPSFAGILQDWWSWYASVDMISTWYE